MHYLGIPFERDVFYDVAVLARDRRKKRKCHPIHFQQRYEQFAPHAREGNKNFLYQS